MTEDQQRQLSALLDGALDDRQTTVLVDQAVRDPDLRAAWERYHLIGQALRGEHISLPACEVATRVRRDLESEPVPIRRCDQRRGGSAGLAPFAGAALAAAAAFVAVFAVPSLFQWPGSDGLSAPSGATGPRSAQHSGPNDPQRRWNLDRPELSSKLDLFLVNHQEAAPSTGVKGMLPYATLVGYESTP